MNLSVEKIKRSAILKRRISRCFSFLPFDRLINKRYIFVIHRVLPESFLKSNYCQSSLFVTPGTLQKLIEWSLSIGDVVEINKLLDFKSNNPGPLFSFTFDDGWRDNYDYAFPIFKKYGLPAIIFLATDAINTGKMFWPEDFLAKADQAIKSGKSSLVQEAISFNNSKTSIYEKLEWYLEELKKVSIDTRKRKLGELFSRIGASEERIASSILTWDQIREMSKSKISYGSHTHTHTILQYADNETIDYELKISKEIIEKEIGKEVKLFSYPNARYRAENGRIVAQFYDKAFRIHNLPVQKDFSRFFIPRIMVNESICETLSFLKFRLLGVPHF